MIKHEAIDTQHGINVQHTWLSGVFNNVIFENRTTNTQDFNDNHLKSLCAHIPRISYLFSQDSFVEYTVLSNCPDYLADIMYPLISDNIDVDNYPVHEKIAEKLGIENKILAKLFISTIDNDSERAALEDLALFYVLNYVTQPEKRDKYKNDTLINILYNGDVTALLRMYEDYHNLNIVHHEYTDKIAHIVFNESKSLMNNYYALGNNFFNSDYRKRVFYGSQLGLLMRLFSGALENGIFNNDTIIFNDVFDNTVKRFISDSPFIKEWEYQSRDTYTFSNFVIGMIRDSYSLYNMIIELTNDEEVFSLFSFIFNSMGEEIYSIVIDNIQEEFDDFDHYYSTVYCYNILFSIFYYELKTSIKNRNRTYLLTCMESLDLDKYDFIIELIFELKNAEEHINDTLQIIDAFVDYDEKVPVSIIVEMMKTT